MVRTDNGSRSERAKALKARRRRRRVWLSAGLAAGLAIVLVVVLVVAPDSPAGRSEALPASDAAGTPASTTSAALPSMSTIAEPGSTTTVGVTQSMAAVVPSSTTTVASSSTTIPLEPAPIVRTGPSDRKWIALTFDDNYQKPTAYRTLAALEEYQVQATMFVIGHYLDLGPDLALQIAAGGFEVGDHTRSHADCTSLSKRGLRIEIGNGTDHYHELTGAPTVALFRPPGGFIDDKTCEVAAEKGFEYVVMWDIDTNDWRGRSAAQITETVMANAHNGAIVLMHMAADHTAEAIPQIVTRLKAEGYELVTLSTMLGL